jgi:peptidoglycan L-alanyl-D-glutamate endopeptidase CwlK
MDSRSERNLNGVHPDLVKVVRATVEDWTRDGLGLIVTEGLRTHTRQAELYKVGASQTMNSRHLTGHAVDLAVTVNGDVRWDWPLYFRLGALMKSNARRLEVPMKWGGDWKTFKDGPHFELDWEAYPVNQESDSRSVRT